MTAEDLRDYAETDIAIVGMAGRFPGADDVDALWRRVVAGDDCLADVTVDQARAAGAHESDLSDPDYVLRSGTLNDVAGFDHEFFGIGTRDADIFDPQHRHFLECAWSALEMSTHLPETFDGAIGVFGGCGMNTYLINNLLTAPGVLDSMGWFLLRHTGNDKDFLATNVAYRLDLRGPAVNVQTACSTSLVAIHLAIQSLLSFECDLALAGGSTIEVPHGAGYLYRNGEILAPDGRCRAFDEESGGTVLTSGVGTVALRRVGDAIDDGDPILAVIKASAVNNDGARKVSFLAPSVDGHADVVLEALAVADLVAEDLQLIEAHGTGTSLGDSIEIAALTEAVRSSTDATGFCRITSTKPNIGHLDTAAGVASVIKVVQALRHQTLPPMANYTAPSTTVAWDKLPFHLSGSAAPWPGDRVRRAGVSSLGVGGTNAHLLLEEAPRLAPLAPSTPEQTLTLSALSAASVTAGAERLADYLERHPEVDLGDVAHTLITGRRDMPHRRVLTATNSAEAIALLRTPDRFRSFSVEAGSDTPQLGFMFPGGGTQYAGMGAGLDDRFATFHAVRSQGAAMVRDLGGPNILPGFSVDGDDAELRRPSVSLPSVFVTSVALARQWMEFGAQPDVLLGHSLGEYAAAHLAGVINLEDALSLVVTRSRLMEQVGGPDTAMMVVSLPEERVVALLPDDLSLAVVNTADECVVAGKISDINAFAQQLDALDATSAIIPLGAAAHSYLLDPVLDEFRAAVRKVTLSAPQIRYPSNLTGTWITDAQATNPDYWVDHLRGTVRSFDGVRTVCADQPTILAELGPGHSLSSAARRITGGPIGVAPALRHPQNDTDDTGFSLQAYARLWALGANVDRRPLIDKDRRKITLPTYAFDHTHHWVDAGERQLSAVASQRIDDPAALPIERLTDLDDFTTVFTWSEVEVAPQPGPFARFIIQAEHDDPLADALVGALNDRELQSTRVAHGMPLDPIDDATCLITIAAPASGERPDATTWFCDLAECARSLGSEPFTTRIVAVTRNAFAVNALAANPSNALVSGLVRVAGSEYDSLDGRAIDIDEATSIDRLLDEVISNGPEMVALRDGIRLESVEQPTPLTQDRLGTNSILTGGTYLVTGAFGGVGSVIAEHLVRDHQANLALLCREHLPTGAARDRWLLTHGRDDPMSRRLRQLALLESYGTKIEVIVGDTADAESLRAAITTCHERLGSLDGAVHSAGVMNDQLLGFATTEDFTRVIEPKLTGALVLFDELTRVGATLLMLVGSTSAVLAPAGQAAYAGANVVLDQMAGQHGDLRVATVDFGLWSIDGMATNAARTNRLGTTESAAHDHPILDTIGSNRDGATVLSGRLDPEHHWVVNEHRIGGETPVLPGTGHIDLMLTAAVAAGIEQPSLNQITLLDSIPVPDSTTVHVRVTVSDQQVTVERDEGNRWRLCSEARVEPGALVGQRPPGAMPMQVDDPLEVQRGVLDLGAHWNAITGARRGEEAAEVSIDLDDTHQDVSAWAFHPALADLATTAAVVLAPTRSDQALWVPVQYERVTAPSPLPSRVTAVAVRRPASHEHVIADISIFDADENLVAEIVGLELRAIDPDAFRTVPVPRVGAEGNDTSLASLALEHGLTAHEGVALFDRVLRSSHHRVLASSLRPDEIRRLVQDPLDDHAPQDSGSGADASSDQTVQASVSTIWQELLGVDQIDDADDFFDLGGHSLIAIRLLSRIHRDLGVRLELADLLSASTVPTMTARLLEIDPNLEQTLFSSDSSAPEAVVNTGRPVALSANALHDQSMSNLVTVSAAGEGRPFYVVHGAGGNVLFLWSLARAMSGARPLHGFQAQGVDGATLPDSSVEEMAARYVAELREHSPGPYLLGGFSGGGLVTLEMVRQLQELGEEVDLAVLFDSAPTGRMSPGFPERVRNLSNHILRGSLLDTVPYMKRGIARRLRHLIPEPQAKLTEHANQERALGYVETESQGYVDLFHYISAAADRYTMKNYAVDVLLVKADRVWPGQAADYHWGPYIDGTLTTISVPGDHHSMFFPESAPALAAALAPLLHRCDHDWTRKP